MFCGKEIETKPIFSTCKCNRTKTSAKYRFVSHFHFPKTSFPYFLHHLCLQFLYPITFLIEECFPLVICIDVLIFLYN